MRRPIILLAVDVFDLAAVDDVDRLAALQAPNVAATRRRTCTRAADRQIAKSPAVSIVTRERPKCRKTTIGVPPTQVTNDDPLIKSSNHEATFAAVSAATQQTNTSVPRTALSQESSSNPLELLSELARDADARYKNVLAIARTGHLPSGVTSVGGHKFTVDYWIQLGPDQWIGDNVINATAKRLFNRYLRVFTLPAHLISCIIVGSGTDGDDAYQYERVQRWTKRAPSYFDDYDFVALPLHRTNHWVLLVVAIGQHRSVLYDPAMAAFMPMPAEVLAARMWLGRDIHDKHAARDMPVPDSLQAAGQRPIYLADASWPTQQDQSFCGVFVLGVVAALQQNVVQSFSQSDVAKVRKALTLTLIEDCKRRARTTWKLAQRYALRCPARR